MKIVIFDWKRTLYDPDNKVLMKGALEVLSLLKKKNIPLVLVGKGNHEMHDEVEKLGVRKYFLRVDFREGPKQPGFFTDYIDKKSPQETIIVGDRIQSELEIGNTLGATTIWVKQGKFSKEKPQTKKQTPSYIVHSLYELKILFLEIKKSIL